MLYGRRTRSSKSQCLPVREDPPLFLMKVLLQPMESRVFIMSWPGPLKIFFAGIKTQQGFQVKRKAGWDTHGLPVELGVENSLNITKEDIGNKISIEDFNAHAARM